MKLYTKRGDAGLTDLFGGRRVSKDDLRVEAYGTVDELNSVIGLVRSVDGNELFDEIAEPLRAIQSRLFELGADLATPRDVLGEGESKRASAVPRIGAERVAELEAWIDAASAAVPAMRHFILPGGTQLAARLHVARTVCRRAERLVVALAKAEPVGEQVVVYLNRLSDLLFALAPAGEPGGGGGGRAVGRPRKWEMIRIRVKSLCVVGSMTVRAGSVSARSTHL